MKEHSLVSLLNKYSICVPAIQREYVQGFDDKKTKEIRNNFLNDIFMTLSDNNNKLKINIIYGYCNKDNFYPVDGQQRLTTLYLVHWFLWIKSNNQNTPFIASNRLQYEIRQSADLFLIELVKTERYQEFQEMVNSKESFANLIVLKVWFKSTWINDPTVLAILNVISELKQKNIGEQNAREYFNNLKNKKVYFDFFTNDKEDAKKKSIEDYIKLNSRGKQIDIFDSIKALINSIENQLGVLPENRFVAAYDRRYIDLFYNLNVEDKKALEQITSEINDASINFLINSYNLLYIILGDNHDKPVIKSFEEYYSLINSKIFLENDKDIEEAKKYFEFVNNALETILNLGVQYCKDELLLFFNSIVCFNENYNDGKGIMARLIYFDFYILNQKNIASLNCIKKFEYILQNFDYNNWIQINLGNIKSFCFKVSCYIDIMEYFAQNTDSDVCRDMKIGTDNKILKDIKRRIKEQRIKVRICKRSILSYNHFDYLESIFPKQRSIYFLLQFSQLWNDLPLDDAEEKIVKLQLYMDVAKELFSQKATIKLRKLFAVATYYNEAEGQLDSSDLINKNVGLAYKVDVNKNNLHYWDDNYYFIDDNMLDEEKEIKQIKLKKLKLAYDLYCSKEENVNYDFLTQKLQGADYIGCWLQYAINNHYEELLFQRLKLENGKIKIEVKIEYFYYDISEEYINFFAYLYMKKKEEDGWNINKYSSDVYDLSTVNVKYTTSRQKYVNYDCYIENKNLINAFELKLLWQNEEEIYVDGRTFFYSKHLIEIIGDSDTLISVERDRIIKRVYNLQDYIEYHYDFSNGKKIIKEKRLEELQKIKMIVVSYKKYLKKRDSNDLKISILNSSNHNKDMNLLEVNKLNGEIECVLKEYKDLIRQSYDLRKSYNKNGKISKYLYKDVVKHVISKKEFVFYKDVNKEF